MFGAGKRLRPESAPPVPRHGSHYRRYAVFSGMPQLNGVGTSSGPLAFLVRMKWNFDYREEE